MLDKTDGAIDWTQPARAIAARIRGVDPWPGAYATLRGQPIKLFRAVVTDRTAAGGLGSVLAIDKSGLHVSCTGGVVAIREVQAAGKKRMPAAAFAAGRGIAVGDRLT
jgi:methionyl-tRNA formyltransferase